MAGINKVIPIGNLGADPEVRYTQSGSPVANLRIATSERWTSKDGQPQERTEWHRIVTFGRLAEHCRDYLAPNPNGDRRCRGVTFQPSQAISI